MVLGPLGQHSRPLLRNFEIGYTLPFSLIACRVEALSYHQVDYNQLARHTDRQRKYGAVREGV